jgi:septal ring factor EnvC (AmiA/AmiB activator)|tara:strand:+ start:317 stop:583 length:267 start_codon:yes stop_codon:yes gene_type:complete
MSFWAVAAITASAVGGLFTMQMSHAGENGHSSMANRSEVSKVQIKLERVSTKVNHNAEVLSELKDDLKELQRKQSDSSKEILEAIRGD